MAEFPELGKNCSLETCKKLDFTPFFCDTCEKYFCDEHRFGHGCQLKKVYGGRLTTSICNNSKPLKPYLCSKDGCFISEIIRIDCQRCGFNFCLKHRYPEEHQCHIKDITNEQIKSDLQERLRQKLSATVADDKQSTAEASIHSPLQKTKSMDETVQKKADRIAIMRLKLNTRDCNIPATEQMFLFVTENQRREPVMVSKHWTIGRCLDHIVRQYSIPNDSASFGTKMLRLYCETDQANPLPMSNNVGKCLKDCSNVFLKRDK